MSDYLYAEIIGIHIELLNKFEDNATPDIFQEIFGERIGNHLWDKYIAKCGHSILWLYPYLDVSNREKLCEYLYNAQGS